MKSLTLLWIPLLSMLSLVGSAPLMAADTRKPTPTANIAADSRKSVHMVKVMDEIPINAGETTYNPPDNQGFNPRYKVSWHTGDLWMTIDGKAGGTFTTKYAGPRVASSDFKDVLFVQVAGSFILRQFGGFGSEMPEDVIPVIAVRSTPTTAIFDLGEPYFYAPQRITFKGPKSDIPLYRTDLNLTWVRVYKFAHGYAYHIFPGHFTDDDNKGNVPVIAFNQQPQAVHGQFDYYRVLPANLLSRWDGNVNFNYRAWLKRNMRW